MSGKDPWFVSEAADQALASLDLAAPPVTPPEGLWGRIAEALAPADSRLPVVVQLLPGGRWRTLGPGVRMKRLWERTYLLQCEPGAVVPDHDHPSFEHALVVSGDLVSEFGTFGPGDYHGTPKGSEHAAWTTRSGCVVMVQYAA